jgi:FAD/FMN-containing dehydrogenase
MDRRDFCKAATALGLTAYTSAATTADAGKTKRRVRPGEAGWPGASQWDGLKSAVDGNLIAVTPLFDSCHDSVSCQRSIKNPFYIGDQAGGTQVSGYLKAWQPAPSVYAVGARRSSHVVAAVNFARDHNLRLVVKGGGHSYHGTSNAPDSLLIWTRAMNGVELHDAFVPDGCAGRLQPQPAVSVQAGAMWIDVYDAVTTRAGRYVQGGGCTTVGVAGLIQSGGFGSFSKKFGSASGSLLEAEIVTADGRLRTVNPCSDPELFWALKGGGGGNWGVVTRVTLKTHDLPEHFGGAEGKIRARSAAGFQKLVARFVDFYADHLCNPHWGEQVRLNPDNTLELSFVCQGLTEQETVALWKPFFDQVAGDPDLTVNNRPWSGALEARHWWDAVWRKAHGDSMIADPRPGAPASHAWWSGDSDQCGAYLYAYESGWLPASLLRPAQRPRLVAALLDASRHHSVELHFNKGLAGAPAAAVAAATDTAINPRALSAFALAIIADGGPPAYPGLPGGTVDSVTGLQKAREVGAAMEELRKLGPEMGSYYSESSFFEADWQHAHWGEHYSRLRAVKAKYDPDGLFWVHHGPGSEAWSADGFERVG